MREYTLVCFVYGWTYNYHCTHLPEGCCYNNITQRRKGIQPPCRTFITFFGLFFSSPSSPRRTMCMWHIQDEQQRDISVIAWEKHIVLSGLLFCMTGSPEYMMAQSDVKVLWVQVEVSFLTMLEKGLVLILSL